LGDDGQPTMSRTGATLLANYLAERLDIAHKWKFWHINLILGV
jgi:hypothetical protein